MTRWSLSAECSVHLFSSPWLRLMFCGAWAQGRLVGIFQGEFMYRQNHICVAKVRSMVWSCNGTGCQKHFCIIEYFKVKYMQRCTSACLDYSLLFAKKSYFNKNDVYLGHNFLGADCYVYNHVSFLELRYMPGV